MRVALQASGISAVLLKGAAFAHLLYGAPERRDYSDVDLLVAPADGRHARDVLRGLGFTPAYGGLAPIDLPARLLGDGSIHGGAWYRERDGVTIDLHHTLPQVVAEPALVWTEVSRHTTELKVGGVCTTILDRPASALLVALHAAHHGREWGGAMEDLRRATERFDIACWQEALELATTLDARAAMGAGLGLTPKGVALAEQLGVPTDPSFGLLLRWNAAPWGSSFVDALLAQPGGGARLSLLAHLIWPRPTILRLLSPLARRGRRGLVAAYVIRPVKLLWRAPAAVLALRRVRRASRSSP